jgi:hypothetical protein
MNVNNTIAVLQTCTQSGGTQQLKTGDHKIEAVNSFVYLGFIITGDNDEYIEIQRILKSKILRSTKQFKS